MCCNIRLRTLKRLLEKLIARLTGKVQAEKSGTDGSTQKSGKSKTKLTRTQENVR